MSASHKAALAEGRQRSATIRAYLEALETPRKRGRKRTPEGIRKRLAQIESELPEVNALRALELTQERFNLEDELSSATETADIGKLEAGFVKVAKGYADDRGISYTAFRAMGVPPDVLAKAKIARTRRS
jgi:hypothetical protein